jgi:hypothetical protein
LIVAVDQNVVGIRPSAPGGAHEEALYDVAVPMRSREIAGAPRRRMDAEIAGARATQARAMRPDGAYLSRL